MDPRSQMVGARNPLTDWMDQIPGYRGYKRKEQRREADRALRMYLAGKLEALIRRMDAAKLTLLNNGGLAQLTPFEQATTKLRIVTDTVRAASQGYAGLFDAAAVREPQLDALYDFDKALDEEIDRLGAQVGAVETAVATNQSAAAALSALMTATDALLTHLHTRDQAILTGDGLPERPPHAVLEAPKPLSPAFVALQNLRLNDALSVLNTNYVVTGRVKARVGERTMMLARLSGGAADTWLWIGETERDLALLTPYTPATPIDTATGSTVTIDGDTLSLVARGFGALDLDGPSGSQKDVPAQLACFKSDLQVLWSERVGAQAAPTLLNGLTVDLGSVTIFRR